MPAEEIGDRMREIDSKGDIISHSCVPEFYLAGRQLLIDLGHAQAHRRARRPRVRRGLRRAAQPRLPPQPRARAAVGQQPARPAHPRAPCPGVRGRRDRHQAGRPAVSTSLKRFMATANQYALLSHCESRLGIFNHGPYRCRANEEMLVRGYVDLGEGDLPWLDGIASGVTHNNLTIPVILKDTHFNIVDDWNSFEAQPSYDHDERRRRRPLHLGLPLRRPAPGRHGQRRHAGRLPRPRGRDPLQGHDRAVEGDGGLDPRPDDRRGRHVVLLRGQGPRARRGRLRPRRLVPDRRARRSGSSRCSTTSTGATSSPSCWATSTLPSQQGSPYTMSKWTDPPGDMWWTVPYSVLTDDEYTLTSGPLRPGSTTLPHKQGTYLTTRGRLHARRVQRRPAATSPRPICQEPYRFLDDAWVRGHADTPLADELYRIDQRGSVLEGRGAGVTRAEMDEIRRQAGGHLDVRPRPRPARGAALRRRARVVGRGTHAVVRRVRAAHRPAGQRAARARPAARRPGRLGAAQLHRGAAGLRRAVAHRAAPRRPQRPRHRGGPRVQGRGLGRAGARSPTGSRCPASSSRCPATTSTGCRRPAPTGPATCRWTRRRSTAWPTPAAPPAGPRACCSPCGRCRRR